MAGMSPRYHSRSGHRALPRRTSRRGKFCRGAASLLRLRQGLARNQADIKQAVQDLNTYAQSLQRDLYFSIDEESGETVVKVMDHESGEVIRQIPTEEVLAIAHSLKSAQGLLLSAKA